MASTFSPTLRIELIGDGDQSGIWGQTTNVNLGTLLEQAITGVVSITMADANYTLTNFNGVSDESRNAVLVVGGTNAAVRDVITPLVEKLYVVKNSTVGGFAINIRAASGSSVSVPSGATVWVYCDGTNFNAINTESVGNFEVNGNLTVTGNTNAVAATYTGNVAALNISTANVTATGAGAFTGNVSAANFSTAGNATATNFIGSGLTLTAINASNISAGTIANARTTAASANGASTIVARDSNGSFAGNVGTFVSISGAVSGNGAGLTDINASNISSGTIANARTTAATANGASTIVLRGTSGEFSAGAITVSSISGNGAGLTDINASNISSGTVASARVSGSYTGITGVGTLTAGTWNANVIGNAYTTANSANGANTIVARDANGNFTANAITTTSVSGNGAALTAINASNISSGTLANARTTADSANGASTIVARDSNGSFSANVGTFVTVSGIYSGNGAGLTDINASNITSGTISNARTTAASANGASTIVLRDSNGSFAANVGTFVSISGNGAGLTDINASNISSGTVATARLGSGTANSTTFLRGDQTYAAPPANATSLTTTNFTIQQVGSTLVFQYNGANVATLSSTGTFNAVTLTAG